MAAKQTKEISVEQKLRALYDLQLIDSRIDKIRTVRGELPLEVQDLEDEIAGLTTRVEKSQADLDSLKEQITAKEKAIAEAKALIKKYEEQQNKVRNNREFDSLSKEIEFQNLEIQLAEKHIKEFKYEISNKTAVLEESTARLEDKQKDLDVKKGELEEIISETQKEEEILVKKSEEASKDVDERLLSAYRRIRQSSKNGLAVVAIQRGASGGSFIKIPPQRQLDVAARKKVIVDEHSGRILVDEELANEETERMNSMISKLLK
ncbi:MAG: zinc ribbon domain-containing protein [Flavobacteriales bacterium]